MVVQATGFLGPLNRDSLRNILDFYDLKERSSLRSCSKGLQSVLQPIPKESKAFLVFESKLPLIKDIVRMTPLHRARELSLQRRVTGDQTDAYLEESTKGDWRYIAAGLIGYCALLEIVDIGGALKNLDGLEGEIAATGRLLSSPELVLKVGGTLARYFSSPECFMIVSALVVARYLFTRIPSNAGGNIDQSVPLMERWYDLQGTVPEDLLVSGNQLEAQLIDHNRQANLYSRAGGMDRYYARRGYTDGGLDLALDQIRHENLLSSFERLR